MNPSNSVSFPSPTKGYKEYHYLDGRIAIAQLIEHEAVQSVLQVGGRALVVVVVGHLHLLDQVEAAFDRFAVVPKQFQLRTEISRPKNRVVENLRPVAGVQLRHRRVDETNGRCFIVGLIVFGVFGRNNQQETETRL